MKSSVLMRKTSAIVVSLSLLLTTSGCVATGNPEENRITGFLKTAKENLIKNTKAHISEISKVQRDEVLNELKDADEVTKGKMRLELGLNPSKEVPTSMPGIGAIVEIGMDSKTSAALGKINENSTFLDLLKAFQDDSTLTFAINADIENAGFLDVKANLRVVSDNGKFHFKLSDTKIEGTMPNMPPAEQIDMMLLPFQSTWYTIDLDQLAKNSPAAKEFLNSKVLEMGNEDEIKDIMYKYMDQVLNGHDFLTVDLESKKENGDEEEYTLMFTPESMKGFAVKNLEFMENNLNELDKVFDLTQGGTTLEEMKKDLQEAKKEVQEDKMEEVQTLKFTGVFNKEGLKKFGYVHNVDEKGNKGTIDMFMVFEDNNHSFKKSHLKGSLDVTNDESNTSVKGTMDLNILKGNTRTSKANLKVDIPGLGLAALNLNMNTDSEGVSLEKLEGNFDVTVNPMLSGGQIEKVNGVLDYENDLKESLNAFIRTEPNNVFSADLDLEGGNNNGLIEASVNTPIDQFGSTLFALVRAEGEAKEEKVSIEIPAETAQGQNLSSMMAEAIEGAVEGYQEQAMMR